MTTDYRGYTDYGIDRMILFLRDIFTSMNLNDHDMTEFRLQYFGDESDTNIKIVDSFTLNLDTVDKQPTISVQRGPITWMNSSIAQRGDSPEWLRGKEVFKDLLREPININCYSRNGLKSARMANIVFFSISALRREMQKDYGFFRAFPLSISEEKVVKTTSDYEIVNVAVSTNCFFEVNRHLEHMTGIKFGALLAKFKKHGSDVILHITDP